MTTALKNRLRMWLVVVILSIIGCPPLSAQEHGAEHDTQASRSGNDPDTIETLDDVLAGHSFHGEAFNEGPRQQAYLMEGTGNVHFEITTEVPDVQKFFNQGIGQLHGFWDLEAERTFRHAASLDEDCAMAYWGAALAAIRDKDRARGFIDRAVELKKDVSERERMYIEALERYLESDAEKKSEPAARYLKDLESIVIKYPDDIEAKAFVAHRIWQNAREGIPIASYVATDALLNDIFEANPLHPAHHYAIHLWDYRHPEKAVASAERCGISAPSIAHMWHMPGHIYSRLKRYEEAVYQQEASARVDHAHMMRDYVMPDEIHNYAHNNEWLIRNLVFLGRAGDALDLAKNMTELPRHPRYNTLDKRNGSASYGRRRLLQVLREFQLFDQAYQLCKSPYLQCPENEGEHVKSLRLLGCSAAMTDRTEDCDQARSDLEWLLEKNQKQKSDLEEQKKVLEMALDKSSDRPPRPKKVYAKVDLKTADEELSKTKKELAKVKRLVTDAEKALLAIDGYQAAVAGDFETAHENLKKAAGEDVSWLGELQCRAKDVKSGLEEIRKQVKRRPQETIPLARLAWCEYQFGEIEQARESFEKLRAASNSMDLSVELFARLEPLASEFGFGQEWVKPSTLDENNEFRVPLDSLGPFRWSSPLAPSWQLTEPDGLPIGSEALRGKPHILIFYLGHGCLHCVEQLQAFAPRVEDFQAAGIDIIAISSDDEQGLAKSIADFGEVIPFASLVSDEKLEVFKKFRAFDDFENQTLHGTFLIDGQGRIRWQDISYEPFMDHEFLFVEAQRLLSQESQNAAETAGSKSQSEPAGVSLKQE